MRTIRTTDEAFASEHEKLFIRHVQMMPARKVSLAWVVVELGKLGVVMFALGVFLGLVSAVVEGL